MISFLLSANSPEHSEADRAAPIREDLPLPTEPPFTAFVGNLAFDITELELEEFFGGVRASSLASSLPTLITTIDQVCQNH